MRNDRDEWPAVAALVQIRLGLRGPCSAASKKRKEWFSSLLRKGNSGRARSEVDKNGLEDRQALQSLAYWSIYTRENRLMTLLAIFTRANYFSFIPRLFSRRKQRSIGGNCFSHFLVDLIQTNIDIKVRKIYHWESKHCLVVIYKISNQDQNECRTTLSSSDHFCDKFIEFLKLHDLK